MDQAVRAEKDLNSQQAKQGTGPKSVSSMCAGRRSFALNNNDPLRIQRVASANTIAQPKNPASMQR